MRVAVLLSGGVDSAVSMRLLADAGHEVEAFYLKVWLADEMAHLGTCPWEDDLQFARAVCAQIDVPLHVVPLQQAYHRHVVAAALEELAAGRTPSPDIGCNRFVKFGAFLRELDTLGQDFDRVATGHYAQLARTDDGIELRRGHDRVKDQTYFLYHLDPPQLDRLLFPIGSYEKAEVRRLAERYGLPNRDRPDSQGICFLGGVRYTDFVDASLGERPGWIRDLDDGRRLGRHRGLWFHTLGQRRGLGLGGGPWYVVRKDTESLDLWVAHARRYAQLERRRFRVETPHWIAGDGPVRVPAGGAHLDIKVRHTPETAPAFVYRHPGGSLDVVLEHDDTGLADGQPAVFYDGELCLGGGVMTRQAVAAPVETPRNDPAPTTGRGTASSRSPRR